MLSLNKKTDYGLRLMIALAKKYKKGPSSLRQLAKENKLPFKFLEQAAFLLKIAGLIDSKEGKNGGYVLSTSPSKISMETIIEALEGPVGFDHHCAGCPEFGLCGQKNVMDEVESQVKKTIKAKTLKELIQK
jgi:Rrf2 family cysteine metabolism transcriptional repressor